jgi:hypothetical protein
MVSRILRATPTAVLGPLALLAILSPGARPARAQSDSSACAGSFQLETVDTLGVVGTQSSITLDAQGQARIAYRNGPATQIRYAHQEGGQWQLELVPQIGLLHGLSLILDPAGHPYIGYGSVEETPFGSHLSAKVAWKIGDQWTIERIDNALPTEVSLGFDHAGTLHAVYFGFPEFEIRYGTRTALGWNVETVFRTANFAAASFSLAFDSAGQPHITAETPQSILHAVRTDAGWRVDRQSAGIGTSLILDATDTPHMATHVRAPADVQYRTRANGVWTTESVDSVDAGGGRGVSLALDRFGRPVLAYLDVAAGTLKLAWKDRGIWIVRTLAEGGAAEGPSLALEGGSAPRISSMDPSRFDLVALAGRIPPPNHAPSADAGGPYAGTVGQRIAFDGTRSADPDGDALAYAWSFGDGGIAHDPAPEHAYAAAGTYPVCLHVADAGCPSLDDSACTSASVLALLDARVFRSEDRKIELVDDRGRQPFRIEPVDEDFRLEDLDPGSLVATFGTGTTAPLASRSLLATDSDGNGVPDLQVTFLTSSLSALLAEVPPGKSQVTLGIEGALRSGARVRGEVRCEVQKHLDCREGCGEVSPNPTRPGASIRFTTTRPGSVEVEVFDAQGRLLGTILPRTFLPAGPHEQRLGARAIGGRPLASGVYFYRVRTVEGDIEGRFSILK